jgi:hypothetical protein
MFLSQNRKQIEWPISENVRESNPVAKIYLSLESHPRRRQRNTSSTLWQSTLFVSEVF